MRSVSVWYNWNYKPIDSHCSTSSLWCEHTNINLDCVIHTNDIGIGSHLKKKQKKKMECL